jgi:two-component system, sensor histidine kinase and response regulator
MNPRERRHSWCATSTCAYAVYGALFGLCFPIGATLIDALLRDLPMTLAGLIEVQRSQPLHWVIDSAPLFLGAFAALGGRQQDQVRIVNDVLNEDIAKRRQVEKELARHRDDLEEIVRDRTAELASANEDLHSQIAAHQETARALTTAMRRAEAAVEAKSEFLANMSHEIRTPMNGVIGMTSLLLDTDLEEEQREFAETVRSCGEALLQLINDILDVSKIEAGKLDLEIIPFALRTTVEGVMDILKQKVEEQGLLIACLVEEDVSDAVLGDPGRVRQVLINLVNNAVKFTEEGDVVIRVSLDAETEGQATVRFEATDTGIGIPANRVNALFESFTQVDASTTRKYGGTGLGLSISKQLSEMMGGTIGVESVEGEGSTFWFTVVLGKQAMEEDLGKPAQADIEGNRMLVVDDNETNRRIVSAYFRQWGCRHAEAKSGAEALSILRAAAAEDDPFGTAILDMQMPEMDGEELGCQIKADPAIRDVRLVMLTSVGQRGDVTRLQELGISAYLMKPIRPSLLLECLRTVAVGVERPAPSSVVTSHSLAEQWPTTESIPSRGLVLLAEDNLVNQKVARKMLERLGHRCDVANDGAEAVRMLAETSYSAVLMDCQMPEMDGYEATRAIRDPDSDVLAHDIPVIAMTANAMEGDRQKCLDAGMDDYLAKPVNPKALAEALDKWLPDPGDVREP